ncbi:MAG TPA: PASTA domain-containing protein, partial [Streptosporangiaceae bacterium]
VAARARRLRDTLAGGGSAFPVSSGLAPPGGEADGARPERLAGAGAATLVDLQPPGRPPVDPRPQRGGSWTRGRVALVLTVAVVIAGLAGWLLAGVSGVAGPRDSTGPPTATTSSRSSAAGLVAVNGGLLAGQPVDVVRQRLRQLGLEPRVVWAPAGEQVPAGTVISVQPTGQVPIGSVVVVTAAAQSHGHGKGKQGGGKDGDLEAGQSVQVGNAPVGDDSDGRRVGVEKPAVSHGIHAVSHGIQVSARKAAQRSSQFPRGRELIAVASQWGDVHGGGQRGSERGAGDWCPR